MSGRRFAIRYSPFFRVLLTIVGLGPAVSGIDLRPDSLQVRFGWGFRATIPRASITGVERRPDAWWGVGAHGWRGRWLVNGTVRRIVGITIDPPGRARVLGAPVTLRELLVSVEDPDGFVEALRQPVD